VDESKLSLAELMKYRMLQQEAILDERTAAELSQKAIADWFDWHPVDESKLSLAKLMEHRMLTAPPILDEKEVGELIDKALADWRRWHQGGNESADKVSE
jgi:hypothetical protein